MQCLLDHGIKTAIELWSTEQAILVSQEKELLLLEATRRQFDLVERESKRDIEGKRERERQEREREREKRGILKE